MTLPDLASLNSGSKVDRIMALAESNVQLEKLSAEQLRQLLDKWEE